MTESLDVPAAVKNARDVAWGLQIEFAHHNSIKSVSLEGDRQAVQQRNEMIIKRATWLQLAN